MLMSTKATLQQWEEKVLHVMVKRKDDGGIQKLFFFESSQESEQRLVVAQGSSDSNTQTLPSGFGA